MKGKLLMCLLALFASFLPSIRWKGKEKTVFLGAKIGVNDSLKKYLTQHLRFLLFFRETDTVLLSSLAWFKVTLVEVGNLRNKKKKGKGRGSLTTFFFRSDFLCQWLRASSWWVARASERVSGFLERQNTL